MDTCICMAASLRCSPETILILLIGYTPVKNKKLKKNHFYIRNIVSVCDLAYLRKKLKSSFRSIEDCLALYKDKWER